MFYTVQDFLANVLPGILKNTLQLSATFTTYNRVSDYETGVVPTGKLGLTIQVQNGEYLPTWESIFTSLAAEEAGDFKRAATIMDAEKKIAGGMQGEVERKFEVLAGEAMRAAPHALCVIYGGLNALDRSVAFTKELRKKLPQATLVFLTCDCDYRAKQRIFEPLLASGEITAVVLSPNCGGRGEMRQLLEGLIRQWPEKSPEAAPSVLAGC